MSRRQPTCKVPGAEEEEEEEEEVVVVVVMVVEEEETAQASWEPTLSRTGFTTK